MEKKPRLRRVNKFKALGNFPDGFSISVTCNSQATVRFRVQARSSWPPVVERKDLACGDFKFDFSSAVNGMDSRGYRPGLV